MNGHRSFPPADALVEHAGFLRALARGLLLDDAQADDVAQQTLVAALERPPVDGAQPRAWLAGVAKNLARLTRRGEGRRARRERHVARREGSVAATADVAARLEIQRRVVDAVTALDEPYRTVVVHRYFDELRPAEIAARLGVPVGTVKTRLKRALAKLRERLDGDVDGGRAAWTPLLLPLALPKPAPATTAAAFWGGLLTVKTIMTTGAVLVAALAILIAVRSEERTPAPRAARHAAQPAGGAAAAGTTEQQAAKTAEADDAAQPGGFLRDTTGRPIAGARVIALRWTFGVGEEPTAVVGRSNADGAFALRVDPDRNVRVRFEHPAFRRTEATLPRGERPTFVLERGAPLRVVVLDPQGRPLPGAHVLARAAGYVMRWDPWSAEPTVEHTILGAATTGSDGAADVGALPPGDAVVRIDHAAYARSIVTVEVGAEPLEREVRLTRGATVRGRVRAADGSPVAGARVFTASRPGRHATTDDAGRYVLAGVRAGEHEIRAAADGHGAAAYGAADWGRAVRIPIAEGEAVDDIDLVLAAATRVRGRVVDADGRGVSGVHVLARARIKPGGVAKGRTGPDGRFDLGPLALRTPHAVVVAFAHPEVAVASVARNDVAPGSVVDVGDCRALGRGVVRGRVVGDLPGVAHVKAERPGDRYLSYTARLDADGRFSLRLPAGRFVLTAVVADHPSFLSEPERVDVVEDEEIADVTLRVAAAYDLGGTARTEGGAVLPFEKLLAQRVDGPPLLRDAWTDREGRYTFEKLPAGRYKVGFTNQRHETKSAVFKETPAPRVVSADHGTLDFVVRADGPTLAGRVVSKRDGQPVRDFEVRLVRYRLFVPSDGPRRVFRTPDGRFRVTAPEAGNWAVEIEADGHAPLRTKARAVAADGGIDLGTITLGDVGRVEGVVRDAAGRPVRFARVYLLSAKLERAPGEPLTGADGRFAVTGVTPGTYTAFVVSPHHPLVIERGVRVAEGAAAKLSVALPPACPLTITVRDAGGRPLPGAKLVFTFDALQPFDSSHVERYEPTSFGANVADADGRIVKPYLPAGTVRLRVTAAGHPTADRVVELEPGTPAAIEVRLSE